MATDEEKRRKDIQDRRGFLRSLFGGFSGRVAETLKKSAERVEGRTEKKKEKK